MDINLGYTRFPNLHPSQLRALSSHGHGSRRQYGSIHCHYTQGCASDFADGEEEVEIC
jgi:hypothetical protein